MIIVVMDGMEKYKLSLVYDFMVREDFKGGEEWFSMRVGFGVGYGTNCFLLHKYNFVDTRFWGTVDYEWAVKQVGVE